MYVFLLCMYIITSCTVHRERESSRTDTYSQFLLWSTQALQEQDQCRILVSSTSKFTISKIPESEWHEDATLILIFSFYTNMKTMTTFHQRREDIDRLRMNFGQLEIFLRDFNVVPRLLGRV